MLESINFEKLKNKVKIYRTKMRKEILTLGFGILIGTSFFGHTEENVKNVSAISIETEYVQKNIELDFREETDIKKIVKTKSKEEICDEYRLFFEQYKIDYDLEEYLITEEKMEDIITSAQKESKCNYVASYDVNELFETIKTNSIEYVKNNSEYQQTFIENNYGTEFYDKDLYTDQLCFEMFFRKAINSFLEKSTNNINEDIHKMQTLKFVYGKTNNDSNNITLGYYEEEKNLIVLSRECIDIVSYLYNKKPEYVLFLAIQHELNHVRQHKCDCRVDDDYNRISYDADSISSILESSAESDIYNSNKQLQYIKMSNYDYSYISERKDESLLLLMALFSEKSSIDGYYNSIFDSDWISLLKFFDLNSKKEQYTFFKLLYIIDASNCRNDLPFLYYNKEELENGITYEQLQFELGYGYRTEIFKICLGNLVEYTKIHEDFDLVDNLLIFNIIKNKIVDGAYKTEFDNIENRYVKIYDESFVNEVLELENKYVNFLSEYYKINIEKIRELEDSDIYWYEYSVTDLSIGRANAYSKGYDKKAQLILQEFPILKPILFTNYYHNESYEKFINEESVKQKIYK